MGKKKKKESNSGWKSSFNSQDEYDVRCDVFFIPLGQIFVLFLCIFTNISRGVKPLGLEPSENEGVFFLTKSFTAHEELALTRIADIHWHCII